MMENIDKISLLRQKIPVGLRYASELLRKTDNDVEKAIEVFQQETLDRLVNNIKVSQEMALRHLQMNDYDFSKSIISIDEELYTLTERILRKSKKDKESALEKLVEPTEAKYHAIRNYWLDFDSVKETPAEIYCFLTLMDWLAMEAWEGFDDALLYHAEIITSQLEVMLKMSDLAKSLKEGSVIAQNKYGENSQNPSVVHNKLIKNKTYQRAIQGYNEYRTELIDRLYELVENNLKLFP